jgi:hypothetical protein
MAQAIRAPRVRRRLSIGLWAAVALASVQAAPAWAASTVERPYDPPPGSRWIIETSVASDEMAPGGATSLAIKTRAELTVEQRTAAGFVITYVNRGVSVEDNGQPLSARRALLQALANVEVRATADLSGKPLSVDNLDEVRGAVRSALEKLAAQRRDDPLAQAAIRRAVFGLIDAGGARAASALTGDLTELAKAQNTGLEPGKYRHIFTEADNPMGGDALRCNVMFHLVDTDPAAGRLKIVSTFSYDTLSTKSFLKTIGQKFLAAVGEAKAAQIDVIVEAMVIDLDGRALFEVEDGMTRKITETSVTKTRAMGQNASTIENRIVTVTRAP